MPTGYTAAIADGITFEQFAMSCARAFGATITMRDEPSGAEIPERFEPSAYHLKQRALAEARLAELEAMKPAQMAYAAGHRYQKEMADYQDRIASAEQLRAKYKAMLAQVNAWSPPSSNHTGLQEFMRDQITQSIDFDCDMSFCARPEPLSAIEWHRLELKDTRNSIAYHEKAYQEEVERTENRNEWLRLLRESLSLPSTTTSPETQR